MKKTVIVTLAMFLTIASSQAMAATTKCKVTAVDDNTISLDCGSKAKVFKVDDEVKIRASKKKKSY